MKDVQFMSAQEKETVLKDWKQFIEKGFPWENFTDKLYKHLTLHCSFIAHYNRQGFYQTYFQNPEDTVKFVQQFDKDKGCISVEYGATYWLNKDEYSDINQAMCQAIEPFKKIIYEKCSKEEMIRDLNYAQALLKKHRIILKV